MIRVLSFFGPPSSLACGLLLLLAGPAWAQGTEDGSATPWSEPRFTADGDVIEVIEGAAEAVDLPWALQEALRANGVLAQEREGLDELLAQAVQARSEGFPRFDLNGNWSRSRDPSFAFDESFSGDGGEGGDLFGPLFDPIYEELGIDPPDSLGGFSFLPAPEDIPAQTFWRGSLDLYWELHPTRLVNAIRVAKKAIRRQEASVVDLENRTLEQTLTAYHRVVLQHEQMKAVEAELAARREFLELTRRRFLLTLATPLDTLQAAVSLANLLPDHQRARQQRRAAAQDLNVAMGRDPLAPIAVVARFPIEEVEIDRASALVLAARRPDVEQLLLSSEMLRTRRSVQKAEMHPYLAVEGAYGYVTRELNQLFDTGHDFWRASVTLTWPLWDGQTTKGRVRETEASLRRNEHAVNDLRRQARNEVLVALDELSTARAILSAADLNMRMATDAFQRVLLRYEVGKADQLEVLNAQAERFAARTNLIQARFDVLSRTATLKRAMGLSPALPLARALELSRSLEPTP